MFRSDCCRPHTCSLQLQYSVCPHQRKPLKQGEKIQSNECRHADSDGCTVCTLRLQMHAAACISRTHLITLVSCFRSHLGPNILRSEVQDRSNTCSQVTVCSYMTGSYMTDSYMHELASCVTDALSEPTWMFWARVAMRNVLTVSR